MLKRTLAAALVAVGLATPSAAQDLTIAVQKLPDVLEPALENSNVHQRVMYSYYETLVKLDYRDGGTLKPWLATNWEVESPRSIVFDLREGVMFHNGEEMTAEDVAFTFSQERLNTESPTAGGRIVTAPFLGGIESVEVLGRYRVRITMETDDALIVQRFANYPGQIVARSGFEAAGSDLTEFGKAPVGTGPYQVDEFVFGERLVLTPFADYWGDAKAAAERVTFTVVPEIATRIAGLRSGQFDIITEVGPDHIPELQAASGVDVVGGPILNIRGVIYDNTTNDVLKDARIRQALNVAIDRQAIVDSLYSGMTEVTPGWQMDVFGEMFLEDRGQPEFNVEKAQALLAEAGYQGEEIVFRSQEGYYTNEGQTARILTRMWHDAGLNVRLDMVQNWDQVYAPDGRGIIQGSFTAFYPDPVGQIWRRFGPDGGFAQRGLVTNNPEFVALGETLVTNPDVPVRREAFAQMLDNFEADPHGSVLYAMTQFYGIRDDVKWTPYPQQYMNLTETELSFVD